MTQFPDNAEENYKCTRCGHMFGTEGRHEASCPNCGFTCTKESCSIIGTSNEGY